MRYIAKFSEVNDHCGFFFLEIKITVIFFFNYIFTESVLQWMKKKYIYSFHNSFLENLIFRLKEVLKVAII